LNEDTDEDLDDMSESEKDDVKYISVKDITHQDYDATIMTAENLEKMKKNGVSYD